MARDVEFNVTADDDTGAALASAERSFAASQKRIRETSKSNSKGIGSDLVSEGGKSAAKLSDTIKDKLGVAGVSGGQLLGVGLAAAAPAIGAIISAAVIGGAGIGGVIGGVALAARDPRVKSAAADLGDSILGQLTTDAAPFVEPVLRNIAKVQVAFQGMNDRIKRIFSTSSGFLDPLVDGAIGAVNGILRGVDALVSKAAPVIKSFGQAFTTIGDAVGDALTTISGDSEDAASSIDVLANATATLIRGAGQLVRGLTELYGVVSFIPSKIRDASMAIVGWDESVHQSVPTASAAAEIQKQLQKITLSTGEAAGKAGQQMTTYADTMADASSKGRSLYDSQTAVAEALATAKKALDDNGKTLDINTEKGRANRTVLSSVADKLTANYQAYVKVNGEGAGAARIAENNRAKFITLATSFTKSKTEAGKLADTMGLLKPKTINFYANTHDAAARVDALKSKINAVHGKTVSIGVQIAQSQLNRVNNTLARLGGGLYSASPGWAAVDTGAGAVSRVGGPDPVSVFANVESRLYLDGALIDQRVFQQVQARSDRDAWRQHTGRR